MKNFNINDVDIAHDNLNLLMDYNKEVQFIYYLALCCNA